MAWVYNDNTGNYDWVEDQQTYNDDPQGTPDGPTLGPSGVPYNSNQPAGTMDLSYWQSRGVTPDQIFDENGQVRSGWRRTARGYEQGGGPSTTTDGPTYPTGPTRPTTYGGWGGGGGSGLRSLDSLWPDWNPPDFQGPDPFSYPDFAAPTMAEAENEPGYAFAATQGRKQVEATKAAQGVYKSGQTLKDIYAWASEYAKQNYSGVFDRNLKVYGTNRGNAADSYMMNYGVSRDVFDRRYNSYVGGFDSRRRKAELDFGRDWDLYANDQTNKRFIAGQPD